MQELRSGIWMHSVVAAGFPTISAAVFTKCRVFVVDTLQSPQDVEPVRAHVFDEAGDRGVVVVNTHHHWDHVYGNAAFVGCDIVAHDACPDLMRAEMHGAGSSAPAPPGGGVPLPNATFKDRLGYFDEGETVRLLYAPGHTEDSVVVHVPGARILLGGDALEWPFPSFSQRGGLRPWMWTFRRLRRLAIELVLPSHGPPMGPEIIDANERYVTAVYEAVAAARRRGAARDDLDLPAERFVPAGTSVDAAYRAAHQANLAWAWADDDDEQLDAAEWTPQRS